MRQIKLGLSMRGLGYHPSAHRDPAVPVAGAVDIRHSINVARIAERGLFDFLFIGDHAAIVTEDIPKGSFGMNQEGCAEFEPLTLLSAISVATSHIGLLATASTSLHPPYQLARQFLSLDHISGGRAAWNVVTSSRDAEAQNFGMDKMPAKAERYERAREAVEVVFGLWECWEEDAFLRDRVGGRFFDPAKMHPLDHKGKYYRVLGPVTMPRSPQGRPVIAQAGSSEGGMDFAASIADIVYTVQTKFNVAQEFYGSLKERIARLGRNPDHVKIMPGFMPIVGRTTQEAQDKYKFMLSYLHPLEGLRRLARAFGDLSPYDLDGPLPDKRGDVEHVSRADLNVRVATENQWTIRQHYEQTVISHGHHLAVGSATEIADIMEHWFRNGAADGFNVIPATLPYCASDFVDLVVPELQKRGLYRTAYEGTTMRANMGLPEVVPRYRT
jgi:FMN-dependent oxidoreductase (nitrilotriacetate monooxygenase family)